MTDCSGMPHVDSITLVWGTRREAGIGRLSVALMNAEKTRAAIFSEGALATHGLKTRFNHLVYGGLQAVAFEACATARAWAFRSVEAASA